MSVQVLVATMNQTDYSLLDKMNIETSAIVCNQCDRNEMLAFSHKGAPVRWLSFCEKGVGLNRNNALMRADAEICLFADDDMVYVKGYADVVEKAFEEIPDADVIVFNLMEKVPTRYVIPKIKRVNRLNYLRYGTARIAVKLASVRRNGIYFNQCFGGGTEHCHGEDNLFLTACLDKGLRIYAYPAYLAELTEERASTWNTGFTEKYLKDQGVLYRRISRRFWRLLCLQDALRHARKYGMGSAEAFRHMVNGGKRAD